MEGEGLQTTYYWLEYPNRFLFAQFEKGMEQLKCKTSINVFIKTKTGFIRKGTDETEIKEIFIKRIGKYFDADVVQLKDEMFGLQDGMSTSQMEFYAERLMEFTDTDGSIINVSFTSFVRDDLEDCIESVRENSTNTSWMPDNIFVYFQSTSVFKYVYPDYEIMLTNLKKEEFFKKIGIRGFNEFSPNKTKMSFHQLSFDGEVIKHVFKERLPDGKLIDVENFSEKCNQIIEFVETKDGLFPIDYVYCEGKKIALYDYQERIRQLESDTKYGVDYHAFDPAKKTHRSKVYILISAADNYDDTEKILLEK